MNSTSTTDGRAGGPPRSGRGWVTLRLAVSACVLALFATVAGAAAEKVEEVSSHGQRIRLLVGSPASPTAVVLLFAGGHGALNIGEGGEIGWGRGNFLVRSRALFRQNGLVTVVVDAPADRLALGLFHYRDTQAHAEDVQAVIRHARQAHGLPVWLVGTSRGTESAANAAVRLPPGPPDGPDGLVLTASMLRSNSNGRHVLAMDLGRVRVPTLIVHHEDDECSVTPFAEVDTLKAALASSPDVAVLAYTGGQPRGRACQARHYHGFHGIEEVVVREIGEWISARSRAQR